MKRSEVSTTRTAFALLLLVGLFVFTTASAAAKKTFNGKIAYDTNADGDFEILVANVDGTNPVQLTNNTATDQGPAWSPDGNRIAFTSQRDGGKGEIYVMEANGSNQTRLTNNLAIDGSPSWSPDGTKIVFHTNRDGNFEIYVMNADGSNQTRLTTNGANDLYPVWSPDGTRIVFYSNRDGNDEIYLMNADGSGQTRLTNNPGADQQPSFSPDGSKIVFQSIRGDGLDIYLMNADGSNQTRVTDNPGSNIEPVFSPEGDKIAFARGSGGTDFELFTMDVDGSNQVQLTNNAATDSAPGWQPLHATATIGVYRPSTSDFLLRNSNATGPADLTIHFGLAGDLPVVGDWDGDGKTDVGTFRNGQFLLRRLLTIHIIGRPPFTIVSTFTVNFGQAGDLPVAGDWDGDGIDTPGVFRPTTGQWLLANGTNANNSSPAVSFTFNFGQAGDTPLAGDWNGDGIDTVGLFRGSISTFILSNTFTGTIDVTPFVFGSLGSAGFSGDWNADGVDTPGVFNKNLGTMSLNNTNTSGNGVGDIVFNFGQNGDVPLAGDWDGLP
jgi:dipeptidyl aminopeptidase/acylaminoacyl peptidase